jgi:hypothetical protein
LKGAKTALIQLGLNCLNAAFAAGDRLQLIILNAPDGKFVHHAAGCAEGAASLMKAQQNVPAL